MSEWGQALLGEVARITIGRTPPRKDPRYWTHDLTFPFCTIADMQGRLIDPRREGVTELAIQEGKAKRFPAGSLMMSFKLSIGRVGFAARDVFPNEAIARFETNPCALSEKFLALVLEGQDLTEGSGRAVKGSTLNGASLRAIPVAVPPLSEQRRIVDLVAAVDAQIEALETETESIEQTYRRSALGLFTVGPLGAWTQARVDSDAVLRWTSAPPDGWSTATIGEVGTVQAGATPLRAQQERYFEGGDVLWVKTGDLNEGVLVETSEYVTKEALAETSLRVQPPESVLVAMYGGFGQIGRTARLERAATTNQAVSAIRDLRDDVLPAYLHETLKVGRPKWRLVAASSRKDPNITRRDVEDFDFPLPPLAEQYQIVAFLHSMQDLRDALVREATSLRTFRSTLLTALLSQTIEIPESYDALLEQGMGVAS